MSTSNHSTITRVSRRRHDALNYNANFWSPSWHVDLPHRSRKFYATVEIRIECLITIPYHEIHRFCCCSPPNLTCLISAAAMELGQPVIQVRLPRSPYEHGTTKIGPVFSIRAGQKRKRQEIYTAVDGDSINIYEVRGAATCLYSN